MEGKSSLIRNQKNEGLKLIYSAIAVSLLNSFFYSNFIIMIALAIFEVLFLAFFFIKKNDVKFLSYYIIFLSTSMESSAFVGTDIFYGFKNFKIAGINLGILCLLPLFVKFLINGSITKNLFKKRLATKFIKRVLILTLIALITGLVTIVVGDNGVANYLSDMGMFIDTIYIYMFVIIELLTINVIIENNKKSVWILKYCLIAIMISLAVTLIISLLAGNVGNRGGLESLQVSNLVMLLIGTIVLPFYDDFPIKKKILLFIVGTIIMVLSLIYNTNGKMIIIVALLPIILIILYIRQKKYKHILFLLFFIIVTSFFTVEIIIPYIQNKSLLFSIKVEQVYSMLSFWKNDWYENIPSSPKMRLSQFFNILYELIRKPWYLLLGKGYMGTIKDSLNLFGVIDEFSFSQWQLQHGLYYLMHETLNSLFLTNGLVGLAFFASSFKLIIKNIHKSPWLMIGGLWFVLFYSYSITISIYGVTAFLIGLYDIELKNKIDY